MNTINDLRNVLFDTLEALKNKGLPESLVESVLNAVQAREAA